MAHVYFMTRGTKHLADRFIEMLSSTFVSVRRAIGLQSSIQLNLKPIQLYELVYPKEHKNVIYRTLFEGGEGKAQHEKHNKFIWAIRKALGVEPMSDYVRTGDKLPAGMIRDHVEIMFVGEKEDRLDPITEEAL